MKTCRDIMTKNPTCLAPTDKVQQAARCMRDEDIGSVLICEPGGRLSGIITDRDIAIKNVAEGLGPETPIENLMTRNPIYCRENENYETAIHQMEAHQVRRMPIVDEDGKLVGIISQGDIATRLHKKGKTAEVVEEISSPPTAQYRQEHAGV